MSGRGRPWDPRGGGRGGKPRGRGRPEGHTSRGGGRGRAGASLGGLGEHSVPGQRTCRSCFGGPLRGERHTEGRRNPRPGGKLPLSGEDRMSIGPSQALEDGGRSGRRRAPLVLGYENPIPAASGGARRRRERRVHRNAERLHARMRNGRGCRGRVASSSGSRRRPSSLRLAVLDPTLKCPNALSEIGDHPDTLAPRIGHTE